ncbi:dsdna-dependent atpase [Lasallia pustulata]|uniref:Dsdna-dependent atpase n=1 Tax=Lasallia pustulata TaxID=136370 RepID=A0A1W5DDX8_9LECA|nr:dsdna-dependent atpase [Lasallia pustulata]
MLGRPFRPPMLRKVPTPAESVEEEPSIPPAKKRRISDDGAPQLSTTPQLVFKVPGISSLPRKPLLTVKNPAVAAEATKPLDGEVEAYYNVLWRKFTAKKHKTWDGDGVLSVTGGYAYLQDISGRDMGRSTCSSPLLPGSTLSVGGKDVEVDSILSKEEFLAGRPFLGTSMAKSTPYVPEKPKSTPGTKVKPKAAALVAEEESMTKTLDVAAPKSVATKAQWKNPLLASTVTVKNDGKEPNPRHDPTASGAIIMRRPKHVQKGREIVDVVVDPLLTKHLREHQREGVKFMYECVMGMRDFDGQGAILADEMGLGKTLQTIALLWTLLKQNPIYEDPPVIKKALIVCPVTLINNWRKEFRKWLGNERIGVFVADGTKRLTDFTMGKSYSIMIIGYEKLRSVQGELKKGAGVDIVIADEGHRLKTAQNKSAQAIKSLNTARRVILSGTPIQNDLSEFFMMVDFVNPGLLGTFKTFTKEFEVPIVKSRQPGAIMKDIEKGEARSEELASLTAMFILRRTAEILSKYLPPKTEYVLFCRPTSAQAAVYKHVLASPAFQSALGNPEASLQLLTVLKKVCNSPYLLNAKPDSDKPISPITASLLQSIPPQLVRSNAGSTKLRVLDQLLHAIRTTTSEKVILVSNYTSTLDILAQLLTSVSHPFLRLDGSTPSAKRQDLVDTFNRTPAAACFAFLLSAKSGGVGLNLVGGSRLVLFDVDWNPATDLQAMARIHRDGQKRACVVYRFVMKGALDEKIWQRQVTKLGLASSVMEQKGGGSSFTREELRDLFRLDEGRSCQTHDLLGCACGGRGAVLRDPPAAGSPVAVVDAVDGADGPDGTDDDLPDVATLVGASRVDMGEQERRIEADARSAVGAAREGDGPDHLPTLVRASRVDMEEQERRISAAAADRGGRMMESLMKYEHVDTSAFGTGDARADAHVEAAIADHVLVDVLGDEGNRVAFVFARTSR